MYATAERTVFRLMKMHLERNSLCLTSLHLTSLSSEAAAKITTSLTGLCWFQIEDHLSPTFGQPSSSNPLDFVAAGPCEQAQGACKALKLPDISTPDAEAVAGTSYVSHSNTHSSRGTVSTSQFISHGIAARRHCRIGLYGGSTKTGIPERSI